MTKPKDLTGKVYGDWTVLGPALTHHTKGDVWWAARCGCGTISMMSGRNLKSGGSLGCGCTKKGLRLRPFEALYNLLIRESRRRSKKAVELSYEEFFEFTSQSECHYCSSSTSWAMHDISKGGTRYNIDRKDNNLGYSKENCVVCCARCNRAKSDHFTYDEWLQIGNLIRGWK